MYLELGKRVVQAIVFNGMLWAGMLRIGLLGTGVAGLGFSSGMMQTAGEHAPADHSSDEIFEPGGTVKAPKLVHYVEPEFSTSSKEAFVEGTVKISTVVTLEGLASKCQVTSGLNAEEDRTAIEALKKWRFKPGTKDGKPVNVHVTVEVAFHLL